MAGSARPSSFLHAVKTVLFGALGVRRRVDHERETVQLKPVHIVVAGLAGAALFVGTLIMLVRWVVAG